MGKLLSYLDYFLSVLPTELDDSRHPIHVIKKGSGKTHHGDTVAKIWIAEGGKKKIEVEWSELPPDDETNIRALISMNWNGLIAEIELMKKGETSSTISSKTLKSASRSSISTVSEA